MEHPVLLIYLYGIYDSIEDLLTGMTVIGMFLMLVITLLIAMWYYDELLSDSEKILYKARLKLGWITILILLIVNTLMPPKNIAVLMFAADPLIEASKTISDSNRTKSIINILDNSLNYLEKKSKELK
jgi:heme/copper-type cytochrome/quinol oxidase subunit 2